MQFLFAPLAPPPLAEGRGLALAIAGILTLNEGLSVRALRSLAVDC